MSKKNSVAVIILNYNRKDDLLECLESVYRMNYKEFRVIVVDNNSSDDSVETIRCRYPDVHLVQSKINRGVAGGRNLGVKYADEKLDYEFLLFLDDDIIIERDALSEMISSFNINERIGIVTPKCRLVNIPETIGYAGGMSVSLFTGKIADIGGGEKDTGQYDQSRYVPSCGGLCLLKRELINKIGMFDENFNPYGWEDVDLSLRARENSFKIFYNHKAVVYHKGGKKGRGKAINEYEFSKSKNYFYLIKKHANIFQLLSISIILPFRVMIVVCRELLFGEFKSVSAQLRGFFKFVQIK